MGGGLDRRCQRVSACHAGGRRRGHGCSEPPADRGCRRWGMAPRRRRRNADRLARRRPRRPTCRRRPPRRIRPVVPGHRPVRARRRRARGRLPRPADVAVRIVRPRETRVRARRVDLVRAGRGPRADGVPATQGQIARRRRGDRRGTRPRELAGGRGPAPHDHLRRRRMADPRRPRAVARRRVRERNTSRGAPPARQRVRARESSVGELDLRAEPFRWHSRGRDGAGIYILARRR